MKWSVAFMAYIPVDTRRKMQDLIDEADRTMETVCAHIGSGGSAVELAKMWGVPYGSLMYWIRQSPSRKQSLEDALRDRNEYTIETVLNELRKLSATDIRKYFNEDGSLKPVTEFPDDEVGAVQSIEVDELFEGTGRERTQIGWTKKIKFWDKLKAIELIGKNLAIFVDRTQTDVHITLEDLISQSHQPVPTTVTPTEPPATQPREVLQIPPPDKDKESPI